MSNQPIHSTEKKTDIAESIVDAAERLLNSFGYQKMTMTDLAAEAGIGVGTTYLHFASKADVAVAVVQRIHGRMLDELSEIASSGESCGIVLSKLITHRVMGPYNFVRGKLATISWQQMSRHGAEFMNDVRNSNPARLEEWRCREAELVAELISKGCENGEFLPVDPMQTAKTLLAATCGFMPKNLEQHDFANADEFENRLTGVIKMLVNGILTRRNMDGN